jgi:hypothetical protein
MLSNKLKPNYKYDLIRIGNNADGGYLVEKNSYNKTDFLIGLGINDDWSFEKKFNKPFIGVDNQISFKFLFKKLLSTLIKFYTPNGLRNIINYFKKIIYYLNNNKNFINAFVSNYNSNDNSIISLEWIIKNYCKKSNKNIFLKMDIEGSEYRILEEIIKYQDLFTGIVIEFHDIDLHFKKIEKFVDSLGLSLVHIHPNNYGGIDKNGDPLVVEITFANSPKPLSNIIELPHNLDKPNNINLNEINLKFK